jgi:hypothetical protein
VRRTAALTATLLAAVLLGSVAAWGFFSATKTSPQPISVEAPPAGVSHECSSSAATSTNSITIPRPCNLQPGWVLVATLGMLNTNANDQPTWSNIGGTTTGPMGLVQRSFYHVATASEPGNYTFNLTAAGRATVGISAYSGVRTTPTPIEASHDNNGTGTTAMAPTQNASSNTRRIVAVTSATTAAATFPGMTTRWEQNNATMKGASADAPQAPGQTPATNVTVGNGPWTIRTIVLRGGP